MRVRVERHVSSQLVVEPPELVDAEVGAQDAVKGNAADARSCEAGQVAERDAAQARRAREIHHDEARNTGRGARASGRCWAASRERAAGRIAGTKRLASARDRLAGAVLDGPWSPSPGEVGARIRWVV